MLALCRSIAFFRRARVTQARARNQPRYAEKSERTPDHWPVLPSHPSFITHAPTACMREFTYLFPNVDKGSPISWPLRNMNVLIAYGKPSSSPYHNLNERCAPTGGNCVCCSHSSWVHFCVVDPLLLPPPDYAIDNSCLLCIARCGSRRRTLADQDSTVS